MTGNDSSLPSGSTVLNQTTAEAIENEIRAARQVISDSTTQRNVVLEFLLHLQTAQRELANEAELVTLQLPSLRGSSSESGSRNSGQTSTVGGNQDSVTSVNPVQISVLSRLTRLSQRTREVMEDLDRRRNAVGMSSLTNLSEIPKKSNSYEGSDTDDSPDPVKLLRPMRKVTMEERLLVEWSPSDFSLGDKTIPLSICTKRSFSRSNGRELTSR
ncbi:hypothetical protein BY996DRAFT_4596848 [Phakopsora pachyrhizi]|uniref:Expressed protein n=1 Tax=Phakopsora pachyrhizi TaxID=170000 RepID=A0AAV0BST6_PHAPC|nr:hypothetical protein BY996DRAFT_4596848 [Phakopsora pachyrhizi]CAH7688621.1 expressed protein [Phakopsora pachyrhizi]